MTAVRRQRDVLRVAGPEARTYLQGQLSQDVDALDVGGAADTFVLQPTGKVEAWMRISRMADDVFMLDMDAGWGMVVLARLTRFLLRTDCTVEPVDWDLVTVLDAEMGSVDAPPGGLALPVIWPGLRAVDLLGPLVDLPEGPTDGDGSMWEHRRIAAGIPMMGAEMDETTIPGATGVVDRSASFTKGCYTGQELVARVDSRSAGTPTRIVRAVGQGSLPLTETEITLDGVAAGRLTSVATRPGSGPNDGFVALAQVKRAIVVPVMVDADGTSVSLLAD
jgi:folate-binding protein YgfZ